MPRDLPASRHPRGRPGAAEGGAAAGGLGEYALALLAQRWVIAITAELAAGPLRPHELERRLPRLPHERLMRHLAALSRARVVARERDPLTPRHDRCALTEAGYELIAIARHAARQEARTLIRSTEVPGAWALRTARCRGTLAIIRALSGRPLRAAELADRLALGSAAPDMRTLELRLAALSREGLLRRAARHGRAWAPTLEAVRLARLVALAMRWEWQHVPAPARAAIEALPAMLRLLAPLAVAPARMSGLCWLRVDGAGGDLRSVQLALTDGALTAPFAPRRGPDAIACASAADWMEALCGRSAVLLCTGEARLIAGVLCSFSHLFAAEPPHAPETLLRVG